MTPLEHSDKILTLPKGQWLEVTDDITGADMDKGGIRPYKTGDKLRVSSVENEIIVCHDIGANRVWFGRVEMNCLKV